VTSRDDPACDVGNAARETDAVTIRERLLRVAAGQLGHPRGPLGRVVGRALNRGNRRSIAAAVDLLPPDPAPVLADLGFGGGEGLRLLLDRAGASGVVHGVDVSTTMVAAAHRRFARQLTAGRLQLHAGSLTALPLPDAVLTGAITVNTIYFLDDLVPALREIARVLRPGAVAVVGLGDPDAMARLPFTAHGFRLRPVDDVVAAAAQAGLTVAGHDRVGTGADAFHLVSMTRP
jgi:arsenite methyltransferase